MVASRTLWRREFVEAGTTSAQGSGGGAAALGPASANAAVATRQALVAGLVSGCVPPPAGPADAGAIDISKLPVLNAIGGGPLSREDLLSWLAEDKLAGGGKLGAVAEESERGAQEASPFHTTETV